MRKTGMPIFHPFHSLLAPRDYLQRVEIRVTTELRTQFRTQPADQRKETFSCIYISVQGLTCAV